jgi:hypothetical protein
MLLQSSDVHILSWATIATDIKLRIMRLTQINKLLQPTDWVRKHLQERACLLEIRVLEENCN